MTTHIEVSTTQARKATQSPVLHTAGAGCGNGEPPPVCISYPQPDESDQGQQPESRRLRSRINGLLRLLDQPCRSIVSPVWEEEGDQPHFQPSKMQTVPQPAFLIAGQRGKFVLMAWGDIYEAPRCMWDHTPAHPVSVPVEKESEDAGCHESTDA